MKTSNHRYFHFFLPSHCLPPSLFKSKESKLIHSVPTPWIARLYQACCGPPCSSKHRSSTNEPQRRNTPQKRPVSSHYPPGKMRIKYVGMSSSPTDSEYGESSSAGARDEDFADVEEGDMRASIEEVSSHHAMADTGRWMSRTDCHFAATPGYQRYHLCRAEQLRHWNANRQ